MQRALLPSLTSSHTVRPLHQRHRLPPCGARLAGIADAPRPEHSLEVQVPFCRVLQDFDLLPIAVAGPAKRTGALSRQSGVAETLS
jgi:hypothetical protein